MTDILSYSVETTVVVSEIEVVEAGQQGPPGPPGLQGQQGVPSPSLGEVAPGIQPELLSNIQVSFTAATRTVTFQITFGADPGFIFTDGTLLRTDEDFPVNPITVQIPDTNGTYRIYVNKWGALVVNPINWVDLAPVATVYWSVAEQKQLLFSNDLCSYTIPVNQRNEFVLERDGSISGQLVNRGPIAIDPVMGHCTSRHLYVNYTYSGSSSGYPYQFHPNFALFYVSPGVFTVNGRTSSYDGSAAPVTTIPIFYRQGLSNINDLWKRSVKKYPILYDEEVKIPKYQDVTPVSDTLFTYYFDVYPSSDPVSTDTCTCVHYFLTTDNAQPFIGIIGTVPVSIADNGGYIKDNYQIEIEKTIERDMSLLEIVRFPIAIKHVGTVLYYYTTSLEAQEFFIEDASEITEEFCPHWFIHSVGTDLNLAYVDTRWTAPSRDIDAGIKSSILRRRAKAYAEWHASLFANPMNFFMAGW